MSTSVSGFARVRLVVEQLGSRDVPAVMGPNVLAAAVPVLTAPFPAGAPVAAAPSSAGVPIGSQSPATIPSSPSEILTTNPFLATSGTSPAAASIAPFSNGAAAAAITESLQASNQLSAEQSAAAIAARSALSTSHRMGVENDLSPLAEAPEGLASWDTSDLLTRPR
jgi:hypothetical protein